MYVCDKDGPGPIKTGRARHLVQKQKSWQDRIVTWQLEPRTVGWLGVGWPQLVLERLP